jgi:hypothetical protein
MRFRCCILCLMVLFLGISSSWAEWEATITATAPGPHQEDTSQDLWFGLHPDATDGFDEVPMDIMDPGEPPKVYVYAFFIIDDDLYPHLIRDIKQEADEKQWELEIWSDTGDITVTWDISGVPWGKYLLLSDDQIVNMRTEDSMDLPQGRHSLTLEVGPAPDIPLEQGWNLISIPVQLPDNTLTTVLQSIASQYNSVWSYGGEWKRHIVGGPDFLNTLKTIQAGKGYWIQMADAAVLTLDGNEVAEEHILLEKGWNLVGYNCLTAKPLEEALLSIAGNYNSVWAYDATEHKWERHIVGGPDFLNDLETMKPAKGYWIDATDDCEWDIGGTSSP